MAEIEEMKNRITGVFSSMIQANDKIREYALEEEQAIFELSELNIKLDRIELTHLESILSEYTEENKPKYKNEREREIALSKKLLEDTDYIALSDKKKDLGRKLGNAKIEKEHLKNQFEIWKSVTGAWR